MYVCLCKGITDKQIKKCVQQRSVAGMRELKQRFGVGSQCGRCTCSARDVLNEALQERSGGAEPTVAIPEPGFVPQF